MLTDRPSPVQVALLDVNENVGKALKESLDKENGPDKTLFMICNVESEEQIKGNTHPHKRRFIFTTTIAKNEHFFKVFSVGIYVFVFLVFSPLYILSIFL